MLLGNLSVVLASWIGGEETGPAIWSIINGEFNPSASTTALISFDRSMQALMQSFTVCWRATAEITLGRLWAGGRLAQTWPRTVGYVGTHVDSRFGPAGLWQGDYQGMGWHDGEASNALFPFGHGLSFGAPDEFSFAGRHKGNQTVSVAATNFSVGFHTVLKLPACSRS